MGRILVSTLYVLLTAVMCSLPFVSKGEEPHSSAISPAAATLAMRYLRSIDRSASFPSTGNRRTDFIFFGSSRRPLRGWRTIVIGGSEKPRLVWDSFSLHDPYLVVTAPDLMNIEDDGRDGYEISLRGCAPHQCADGRIGFAIYASQTRRTYIGHISTRDDGSYDVTYYPKSGMPDAYRDELDEMMCSDNGISRPSTLPIKCSAK